MTSNLSDRNSRQHGAANARDAVARRVRLAALVAASLAGFAGSVSSQTLETFTATVRAGDTYFAGCWSAGSAAPVAGFSQGAGTYSLSGVANDAGGFVDVYLATSGHTVDIGTNRCLGVSARVLPGNQAKAFRVFLLDSAGKSAAATFLASEFEGGVPQAVGRALTIERGFDPKKIERLRISGDELEGAAPLAIAFNEIAATGSDGTFDGSVLRNFSARGYVGNGSSVLVAGFVINGSAGKQLLVRAAGPALQAFGVVSPLADPTFQVFRGVSGGAGNDNWASDTAMSGLFTRVHAFPFASGSRDSALVAGFASGASTILVKGVGDTSGEALLETYDTDDLSATFPEPRIINASARAMVGQNLPPLIVGFVITGPARKTLLIRAAGPALGTVGLTSGFESDPQLKLVDFTGAVVATNDNWNTGMDANVAASAGAFPFASGSRDAGMLVSLAPGAYATVVTGTSTAGGIVLVEIYEARPGVRE
jgi:hypothetical protein